MDESVAYALLEAGAVVFQPDRPVTFKSGLKSPVYVDNRRLPFHPPQWSVIIQAFQQVIQQHQLRYDVLAGIEAGGIPHSAALGFSLQQPSVFVRKQPKEHGTRSRIEGGAVQGKTVLLIEDMVTTGGSSLAGVEALRAEGAVVTDCLTIVTYGFAQPAFEKLNVHLYPLTTFATILAVTEATGRFPAQDVASVREWLLDPQAWSNQQGSSLS